MGRDIRLDPSAKHMNSVEEKARGSRRDDIVGATLDLAFEVGPDAVSTPLIAKKLGVSQPALYKHFKTKDAIWLALSEQLSRQIDENVRACRASSLAPELRLRELFLRHLAFVQEVPALPDIMVMRNASGSRQVIRQQLQTEMAQLRELMVDLIRQSQDNGEIRADIAATDITTLVMGVMQSLVLRMIVSRDPSTLVAEGERLFDLQIGTLAPRGHAH